MCSRSQLLSLGALMVIVAVLYQYRSDISKMVERYTAVPPPPAPTSKRSSRSPPHTATPIETTTPDSYYNPPFDPSNPSPDLRSSSGTRLYTINELAAHGPNGPLKPILLAVLGRVYNVDRAPEYYGPKGGYKFFAGRDGSRAYVTGEFNEKGLTDDLAGLSPLQIGEIDGWSKFYEKSYVYAGKLIGRYYNEDGSKTKEWHKVQAMLGQREAMEAERKEQEKRFPGCNSRWDKKEGGYVYCSEKSGGIHRDWVGYPRRYFAPGSTSWRCSCVHERDLDSPHVKLYPDCDPTTVGCKTDPEKLRKLRS